MKIKEGIVKGILENYGVDIIHFIKEEKEKSYKLGLEAHTATLLQRVEEIIGKAEDNSQGMVNGVSVSSNPDIAFGRGYRNRLKEEQYQRLSAKMEGEL